MRTLALLALLFAAGYAQAADRSASDYGAPATALADGRSIEIAPTQRNVNVSDGETVHFLVDGKRFDWTFNMRTTESVLELKTIAPPGLKVDGIRVWVRPNSLYQG